MPRASELACFRNPDRAYRDLEQLRSRLRQDLILAALPLLAGCADPDQALNLFERLTACNDERLPALLDANRVLLNSILTLFGQSYWLGEFIVRNPELVQCIAREKHLERSFAHEDFSRNFELLRSQAAEADVARLLAAFKKREYIRIALRDVLGIATLAETTAELSALADVIVKFALREAESQTRARFGDVHGSPRGKERFAILSLGKLGGNELNYSSDLDLFFLYDGDSPCGSTNPSEFYTRLAQILTEILCRPTAEGSVFRIDLRLRPLGTQGEMASALRPAIAYYTHAAHDWELQALIKLRCSAGDQTLAREFISAVQPRVYTPDINVAAIDTALRSRERIGSRRKPHALKHSDPAAIDLKLDPGGIRDIEFLVQCLQRVYGGEETWLRSGGTLFSLQKLHDKGHISGRDFNELTLAYEFIRRIEHHLQIQRAQQVHRLPSDAHALSILQCSLLSSRRSEDLLQSLLARMQRVQEIYQRIIFSEQTRKTGEHGTIRAPSANSIREMSFEQLLERIAQDSPALYEIAAAPHPVQTQRNLHRFLAAALTTPERYAALLHDPATVEKALSLFAVSDHLTDVLVRHPDALRTLDAVALASGSVMTHEIAEGANFGSVESLDQLRRRYQHSAFAIGAHDVLVPRPVFYSLRQSSALAEAAIRTVLHITGGEHTLAIFALGRLGTQEFDLASDADLLFLRGPDTDAEAARSAAEHLIQALGAYTREGPIFAVDARLRPHGSQGELIITPAQLENYLSAEAQPWEALTYSKLRFVAGREDIARLALPLVWQHIVGMAQRPGFASAVAEMRARLERSNRYPHSFKLARGGFYDIDFITSFLLLRNASQSGGNTLQRLEHLHQAGFLGEQAFKELRDAAVLYRTTDHVIRLVTGRPRPELPAAEHARRAVETLVTRIMDRREGQDLQRNLDATVEPLRKLFLHFLQ